MGVPEEEREQVCENLHEKVMMETFLHLVKEIDIKVQEVQRVTNKMNPNMLTLRHIIIKWQKIKDKEMMLKAAKAKWLVTYKGAPIRLSVDFSKNFAGQKG